jgi:hypothetical protein
MFELNSILLTISTKGAIFDPNASSCVLGFKSKQIMGFSERIPEGPASRIFIFPDRS